jgi:hypothetical protein
MRSDDEGSGNSAPALGSLAVNNCGKGRTDGVGWQVVAAVSRVTRRDCDAVAVFTAVGTTATSQWRKGQPLVMRAGLV